jgi:60S ribosome subunit biogenesis protein NIP7
MIFSRKSPIMRELKLDERIKVTKKLGTYIGDNVKNVIDDRNMIFFHEQKVLLLPESVRRGAASVGRDNLAIAGTVLGRFTKGGSFRITVSCLNLLGPWAIHKVWIKHSAEMNFLYGNNAIKSHIFRISENVPMNAGVFVFNQNDVPLGFGITALTPQNYAKAKGYALAVLRQCDAGEYIRAERSVF